MGSQILRLLIRVQLCRQRSPMWRPLQIIGEARLPRRLHEGRPMPLYSSPGLILHDCRFWDMQKTSICAQHSRICAARYGSNCCSENVVTMFTSFRQPCGLRNIQLLGGKTFSCQKGCSIPRYVSSSTPLGLQPIVLSAASKSTSRIPAILGFAR
jgi:hypothetical protein